MKQRGILFCGMAIVYVGTCVCGVWAEEEVIQTAQVTQPMQRMPTPLFAFQGKISLDLRNIDVVDALKFLAFKTGMNIVVTKAVTGRVTLSVQEVNIKDVFDIMLRLNSLAYDTKGEIYNVMTEAEYKAFYGKKFSDTRYVKVFRLSYAIPEQAFSLLDAVKSEIGRLLIDPESGTVLMMDTPEKIEEAKGILERLEQKNNVKIFSLKYAKAKDIEEQLKQQLDVKGVGSIRADERSNQVIVQALSGRMKNIEELIKGLDRKTRAVMVDTKILKIKFSDQLDSGVEWEGIFNLGKQYGLNYLGAYPFSVLQKSTGAWQSREQFRDSLGGSIGAYPFSGTAVDTLVGAKVSPGEKMHIGVIDRQRDFDVLVKYLQTIGKTKILANPTITVVDNQEAKVHVGERRAYVTTTTTTGATTKTTAEEVTYIDVGVQLYITPTINEDGYVTMKVKPEISSIVGNVKSSEGNLIPIIDTSTAETMVMAKDGSTVIIGGLGREEKTESAEQVPLLGNVPWLGFFFRSKMQRVERTELLILLTPIIYEGDRLITPQDKDAEKFAVKQFKKFDVFKQEYPFEIPEPIKTAPFPLREVAPEQGPEGKFTPKGLKSYSLEEIKPEVLSDISPEAAQDTSEEPQILPKSFRPYNEIG